MIRVSNYEVYIFIENYGFHKPTFLFWSRFQGLRKKFPAYKDGWKKIYDSNVSK